MGSLALTLGDPRGIGPEVVVRAARDFLRIHPEADLLLLGPEGADPGIAPYRAVGRWDGTSRSAGAVSLAALETAVELWRAGRIQGVVTGPVHKPSLREAGCTAPGQTELLGELSGAPRVAMLMAAEDAPLPSPLRILLATTHLPLRCVPDRVTATLLLEQTLLLDRALRSDWRLEAPRIALCALNPHASDEGLFGDEEERVYGPALRLLREEGVTVEGPVPADTVFRRALAGEFDAVVAPYHDVGMAAFKTASFGRGVNVTLGLPFVRTSPDHGTAFDLAGTDRADPSSTLAAVSLAWTLARNRFDTPGGHG